MTTEEAVRLMKNILYNVERVIIGKRNAITLMINALACGGHVLIEDVPGVGKTSLAASLAKSVACSFRRIQFTPDIMPSDITGFSVYDPKSGEFVFKPGAVVTQFLLADEINRTSPKTQSSLLEAMEEQQVTVDGKSYPVPSPFMVIATQNPVEYLGTFALPEAQLDRFFMKITLGYPNANEESKILGRFQTGDPLKELAPVAGGSEVIELQKLTEQVHVEKSLKDYIVELIRYTREQDEVGLGASPRASINLFKAAQARALFNAREYVIPDDIIEMAPHVLEHRLRLKQEARLRKITALDIIERAARSVGMPAI